MNPSSRILLCFGFENNQRGVVRQICDRITAEVQNAQVTDIDRCGKDYQRMDDAKQKFDDAQRFPAPQIFIINTTDSSSSVQGLDLYATDLTIVADQCSLHTQRQAVGRSLRMRKRPKTMKREELFPAKRIIVATISGFEAPRPAAEPAPPAPAGPIAAHVPRRAFAQAAEQRLAAARFNVFEMEVQQLRRDNPDADQAALDRRIAQMEAEVAERAAEHAAMVGEAADDSEDELDEIFPAPPP